MGPAYRIVTERCLLRCYEPGDAPALKQAIDDSLPHLRRWLAWAREEPQSLETKVALVRQFRARFDLEKDFVYGIFDHAGTQVFGGAGLHLRSRREREAQAARELGYWVAARWSGAGLATEAAAALVRVAFEVEGVERVEIHCDEENLASAGVARKLGFRHDATLRARCPRSDGSVGGQMVWSLFAEEFAQGPCARAECEAFDALGRRILARPGEREARRRAGFP